MWIQQDTRSIQNPEALDAILSPEGIRYGQWPVSGLDGELCYRASVDKACHGDILAYFKPQLEAVKGQYGYQSEDIVSLSKDTPNLAAILEMFVREHHHTDDEVRVILSGEGIFGIVPQPKDGQPVAPPFEIHVEAGDYINVPANTRHWFTLTEQQSVVALRIFSTTEGWTAVYEPLQPAPETVTAG